MYDDEYSYLSAELSVLKCPEQYKVLQYERFVRQPHRIAPAVAAFAAVNSSLLDPSAVRASNRTHDAGSAIDWQHLDSAHLRKWGAIFAPDPSCEFGSPSAL